MLSPAPPPAKDAPDAADLLVAESLLRSAILNLEKGDYDGAERTLRQGLAKVPEHAGCLATLSICLAEGQRRYVTAERLAARAVRVAPAQPYGYHALGRINMLGGRRQQAFRYLMKARNLDPTDPRIGADLQNMGRRRPPVLPALARTHPLNVALGRVRHFLSTGPHVALVATLLLVTLFSLVTAAYSATPPGRETVERAGREIVAGLSRADSFLAGGEAAKAHDLASRLLARTPLRPDLEWQVRERLGVALTRLGRTDEAVAQLEAALATSPREPTLHVNLAAALLQRGERGRAFAEYETALGLDPENWRARLDFGQLLAGYRRFEQADAYLTAAARLCHDCPEASRAQGLSRLAQGDYAGARGFLERLAARSPPPADDVRQALALCRLRTGDAPGAVSLLAPGWPLILTPDGRRILLEADVSVGDAGRARRLAHSLPDPGFPTDASLLALASQGCQSAGDLEAALRAIDAAIALEPMDAVLHNNRAVILRGMGRDLEAEMARERAGELEPGGRGN